MLLVDVEITSYFPVGENFHTVEKGVHTCKIIQYLNISDLYFGIIFAVRMV